MDAFKDHFSVQSRDYALYRPHYPPELFRLIADLCQNRGIALDCGTGSGQCAIALADHFDRIVAIDPSASQIRQAVAHERITYRIAPSEATRCETESVDVVTVAQALHWFDHDLFYEELRRVLKPGGVFVAWGYGHHNVQGCQPALDHFYHDVVGAYWPPERESIEARYSDIPFPDALEPLQPPEVELKANWNREQLIGYTSTWSAVQKYIQANHENPIQLLREALEPLWPDPEEQRSIDWPLFFIAGRKASY